MMDADSDYKWAALQGYIDFAGNVNRSPDLWYRVRSAYEVDPFWANGSGETPACVDQVGDAPHDLSMPKGGWLYKCMDGTDQRHVFPWGEGPRFP